MSEPRVHEFADQLRQYATHFEMRDWNYTRQTSRLKHIRYHGDYSGYDHPLRRLGRLLREFVPTKSSNLSDMLGMGRWWAWQHPLIAGRTQLRTDNHMPDGWLDNGGIITHWEETGEYLQYVQPSVGALLADLMDAHPELPEVQALADEMKRVNDAYGARVEADDVE
jgi:hypothetical protein